MTTGVVIRLQNLPLNAGTIDIRRFFSGLSVPDGGVHIIGGDDGTAFILFATDEDARQAMMRDGELIFNEKIKLRLSSHTEMRKLIEDSQRRYEELRGLRPPEPPITNLTSRSTAAGRIQPPSPKQMGHEYSESNDLYVELKNLPYAASEEDIVYFFTPVVVSAVRIMRDDKGRFTGNGFVKFKSMEDRMVSLKKDRNFIGPRFVRVVPATERQWLLSGSQPCETYRPSQDGTRKRGQERTPTNEGTPKRSRALSPLRYDNCVELRGLPPTANYKTVADFFLHFQIAEGGLFVELDGKLCKGHAFVEFLNEQDYKAALLKDGEIIEGKQVRVIGISRQAMIEQIKLYKKYMKVKRDEEYRRECEERERNQLKLIEEERKRKNDEEIARKRLKKQMEMEEWLSRQHAKEEEQRKRLELEKRILAQEKIREEEKIRKEMEMRRIDEENRRKREAEAAKIKKENELREEIQRENEQRRRYEEQAKNKAQLERRDGPMPMDLEDDEYSSSSKIVTSAPYSMPSSTMSSLSQQNIPVQRAQVPTSASDAYNHYRLIAGASGSHMSIPPPLPPVDSSVNIRPSIPIQPMPPMQIPHTTGLPPVLPPFSAAPVRIPATITAPIPPAVIAQPRPALPPPVVLAVNPPLPTLPPPPNLPPLDNNSIPTSNIQFKTNGTPSSVPENTNANENSTTNNDSTKTNTLELSQYIRVANSPWHATEENVREFFAGLNIPSDGIKFLANKTGKRSGHIFIRFASPQEADKAALKDKNKMGQREVLVQKTHFRQMDEISRKCGNLTVEMVLGLNSQLPSDLSAPGKDHFLEQKILQEKMTCVRLGNVAENVRVENILEIFRGISIVPGGVQILYDSAGKCNGDVYIELVTPEDCARASNFHGNKKLLGNDLRVLPITLMDMKNDLSAHFERMRNEISRRSPRLSEMENRLGFSGPPLHGDLPRMINPNFPNDRNFVRPGPSFHPQDMGRERLSSLDDLHFRGRVPLEPRLSPPPPLPPMDMLNRDLGRPLHPADRLMGNLSRDPPGFPMKDMPGMRLSGDRLPPRNPGPWDMPIRHPMRPPFPMEPQGMRFMLPQPVPIKMSNLNFKVKPDEILDFFNRYNPIPQSIRFLYNKDGKLSGDGVVCVPNLEAADAALQNLNGKMLLQRKIRLQLG